MVGKELHQLTVEVIRKVEETGFKIVRICADNHKTNTALFRFLNDGITLSHVVKHPVQPQVDETDELAEPRPLFLSFDCCHIIKNVRNQFLDWVFVIDGEEVTSRFLKKIFELLMMDIAVPIRGLTPIVVNPNAVERQKVGPAMKIFRDDTIAAIEMFHELEDPAFTGTEATIKFLKMFNKWLQINDISSTSEYLRKRLYDKKPFYSVEDERLTWLLEDFIAWLNRWRTDTMKTQQIPKGKVNKLQRKKAKKKGLTFQTHEALVVTTLSLVSCVRYLLSQNFHFVLTRRLNSDCIESFFGAVRQMAGGNFKCDAVTVGQAFDKIVRTGIAIATKHGNVPLEKDNSIKLPLIAKNVKQVNAMKKLQQLPAYTKAILDELRRAPGNFIIIKTLNYNLTMSLHLKSLLKQIQQQYLWP